MYKVRAILDTEEDIIRTLVVDEHQSLEDLHFSIAKSFGFDGQEMASFYYANNSWEQGEEIPLLDMTETGEGISMATCVLKDTLPNKNEKLIYVYDFLMMWTFYIEVIEVSNEKVDEPKVILAVGEVPKDATRIKLNLTDFDNEFDSIDFDDEFNNFERLDDIDLDHY